MLSTCGWCRGGDAQVLIDYLEHRCTLYSRFTARVDAGLLRPCNAFGFALPVNIGFELGEHGQQTTSPLLTTKADVDDRPDHQADRAIEVMRLRQAASAHRGDARKEATPPSPTISQSPQPGSWLRACRRFATSCSSRSAAPSPTLLQYRCWSCLSRRDRGSGARGG